MKTVVGCPGVDEDIYPESLSNALFGSCGHWLLASRLHQATLTASIPASAFPQRLPSSGLSQIPQLSHKIFSGVQLRCSRTESLLCLLHISCTRSAMATVAASVGQHPALSSALRDGSSLASASGLCGSRVSVVGSPEISLCSNPRNMRLSSVRAFRQFQQRSSAFTESTQFSNVSRGSVQRIRAQAVSGDFKAVEGEEEKGESTTSTEKPSSSGTSAPSPFAAGKISSKIASQTSQRAENGKSSASPANKAPAAAKTTSGDPTKPAPSKPASASTPSVFVKASTAKPSMSVKPKSLIDDGSDGAFPTGKVSPFAADRLKSQMSSAPSQYNRTSSGRTMINSGKQVLDAFKQGEKDGKTTKFGQPIVPKNIFDDVRQTQAEKDADKFQFSLRPGDLFLVFSFLLIIGLMLGTAFVVWKAGGIHYNE